MTATATTATWRVRDRALALDRPLVMGILNVTPDSFSDGGELPTVDAAEARAEQMFREGVDIVDIGGESTRPGAVPVDARTERSRVVPVVRAIVTRFPTLVVSVDTVKSEVAAAALDAGAHVVNDVSGGRLDSRMPTVIGDADAGYVVMHSRGPVGEMSKYDLATYDDVASEALAELHTQVERVIAAGVDSERIVVDPGLGFAKRAEHSIAMLRAIPTLASWGYPVLVGASRKRFVGELSKQTDPVLRVHGTQGAHVAALALGARLFRVHDVAAARQALDVAWAALRP